MLNHIFANITYPRIIFGTTVTLFAVSPQIVQAVSVYDIKQIAKEITVLIFTPSGSGSGVIITQNSDEYWVLTAGHVVESIHPTEKADLQTNEKGQLIGIHGRAEGTLLADGTPIKAGFNLGIPIQAFLQQLSTTEIGDTLDFKITSSSSTNPPISDPSNANVPDAFRNFVNSHYQVVSTLVESRDIAALYSYLPIDKESFSYQNKQGEIQDYQTTLIKTTEAFSQSVARGETWQVSHRIEDIDITDSSHAVVSFEQIVKWSIWPGLINGITKTKLRESWELINDKWQIIYAQELEKF